MLKLNQLTIISSIKKKQHETKYFSYTYDSILN